MMPSHIGESNFPESSGSNTILFWKHPHRQSQIFGQPLAQLTHKIQYATEAAFTIFILYFLIQTLSQLKVCQEIQTLQNHELSWILQNSHMQALFVTLFQGLHNDVSVNFDVKLPLEFQNVVAVNILKIHLKQ